MKLNFKKIILTALIGYASIIGLYNNYELITTIEIDKDIKKACKANVVAIYTENGMPLHAANIQYLKGVKW